jgi:hypothetical protein
MGGIYELRRSDGLRCHDMHINVHKDWFRHSQVDRGYSQTQRQHSDLINLHLFFKNKENRLKSHRIKMACRGNIKLWLAKASEAMIPFLSGTT